MVKQRLENRAVREVLLEGDWMLDPLGKLGVGDKFILKVVIRGLIKDYRLNGENLSFTSFPFYGLLHEGMSCFEYRKPLN